MDLISSFVSKRNRSRKYDFFIKHFSPTENDSILDVGFQDNDTYSGINYLEKNYPHTSQITALGIEEPLEFRKKYPEVKAVTYDGKNFPFEDKTFDIGWSNAVIEHVGGYESQKLFVKELVRTCKTVYFTTPNRYFPVEVHTKLPLFHFLPKKMFDKILVAIGKKWAAGDYMFLLSEKDLRKLLKDNNINSYNIKRNKFLFFTLDFIVTINSGA